MTGMLANKVVVISGVGPGLGTTLAHRCARDGADLVLAARTVERLEELAKQLNDAGHKALAVRADITDDDEVAYLVESTTATFGKVDVLINNAFRVPSMKPLAGTSFQHIRDAIELSALGALRLIQAFTPALEASKGSIVNVNSMVLRHSQAKYGAYKMAKSALLSMSQSLATELGEKGIRVNSVAPGYIWGETLQGYFEHQAGKYGTTADQIYAGHRGEFRPQAPAHRGRGRVGDHVHGQLLVQRHHRADARRQLRRVPQLMAERTDIATVDELHASATKLTGLDDFGSDSDNYREALGVLLDSYRQEAGLTVLGSKMNRFFLRGALVARLLSESAWKQYPQHADVAVERPIFVTGLVRTGTTALHRLLGADPAHQGLHMWLAEFPQPRPPRDTWDSHPLYRQLDDQFNQHHADNPGYTGLHFMAAYELEECWQLLRQSLHSVSYETLAHLPSYSKWLSQQDWTPAYGRHRKNLQLIGLNDVGKRWVLKNPSHLFALDALMATYPDALVIQTHRPVETIMASMCSLGAAHRRRLVDNLQRRPNRR